MWLAVAESRGAVALDGNVSDVGLAASSASRIVKRYAQRIGLDPPAPYAGHSLALRLPDFGRGERRERCSRWKDTASARTGSQP